MAVLSLVIGSIALFTGGFAFWYRSGTGGSRRPSSVVPVESGRSVHVLRQGVHLSGDR